VSRAGELRRQWRELAGRAPEALALGDDLLSRWGEPHRRYHNLDHLRAVLAHLDQLGPASRAARLGAWYHDAVYEPGRDGNEASSAALARSGLAAIGVEAGVVDEVVRLVHLTASHRADPGDTDGAHLCDADLAVLGSAPPAYDAYRQAVRAEYAAVDEQAWRLGRGQVLEEFLGRDPIFTTPSGRLLWEAPARANMSRELNDLRA
jgi:predicted metal-dependent HD superfamily phosphohydrolase